MSGQAQARVDAETEPNNPRVVTVATALRPGNQNIIAKSATGIAMIITLPDMAEAAGNIISVTAPAGDADDTVSVYVNETTSVIATYGVLDADGDILVVFCTGRAWLVLYSLLN